MQPINGIKDEAFRTAQALLKPQGRAESNRYLVEGENLVRQVLKTPSVHAVYATPESATHFREGCLQKDVPLYVAGSGLMQKLIGTGYETAVTSLAIVQQKK